MWSHLCGAMKGFAEQSTDAELGRFLRGALAALDDNVREQLLDAAIREGEGRP
jgi:hypothetical protein